MAGRSTLLIGGFLGGATSLALTALLFLGQQVAGLPFVPFDLFDWLARALPGGVVIPSIELMVAVIRGLNLGGTSDVAKLVEQSMAIAIAIAGGVLFGAILAGLRQRGVRPGWQGGAVGGLILFLPIAALEMGRGSSAEVLAGLLWAAALMVGWGGLLGAWIETALVAPAPSAASRESSPGRRAFLFGAAGSSLAVALASWGLGSLLEGQRRVTGANRPLVGPARSMPPVPATGSSNVAPAPGTRSALTPNDRFYRIDIDLRPESISEASWVLQVAGLFDNARPLTLADLTRYPAVTQPVTMSCISNPVGGDLIGTAHWTGVRLFDVLKDLGLRPEARVLAIEAADGFYESVATADLADPRTLLVYGMNGATLPAEHGFPLRIYIPNRYGMKQPKWITSIEAVAQEKPGYWVERGWSQEARPQIVSVIDTVSADNAEGAVVPVGGIAWAGDRGIQRVEISVDRGPWREVTLLTPPLGPLTWVLWRFDWPLASGGHNFRVRATDGTGAVQKEESADVFPDGATGYHSVTRLF